MKKTRYLLAFCNVKPTAADKEKLAAALCGGYEKRGRNVKIKGAVSVLRIVLIVVWALCFAAAAALTIYKIASKAPASSDVTTGETREDPVFGEDYTLITPLYQNNGIYDILRTLLTDVYTAAPEPDTSNVHVFVYNDRIIRFFNAGEDDKTDVITSLFAFAEPDNVEFVPEGGYEIAPYEKKRIILASTQINTFEYVISTELFIYDGKVYIMDHDALAGRLSSASAVTVSKTDETTSSNGLEDYLIQIGTVSEDIEGGEAYEINNGRLMTGLMTALVTKIRIENGLPVIYDNTQYFFTGGKSSGLRDPEKELTLITTDKYTSYGVHYCTITSIYDERLDRLYSPTEKTPVSLGNTYFNSTDALNKYYFAPPPPDMRGEICRIINELGCDFFEYLYTANGRYVGIPLYLDKTGSYLTDYTAQTRVKAFFDPYNSALPTFDLEVTPMIISAAPGSVFVGERDDVYPVPPGDAYYESVYTYLDKTNVFRVAGFTVKNSFFSADQFIAGTESDVIENTEKLLDLLGITYTARTDGKIDKNVFIEYSDASYLFKMYFRYVKGSEPANIKLYYDSIAVSLRSAVLSPGESVRYIRSKSGAEYRVDTFTGYEITPGGFVADLDGRIIGVNLRDGVMWFAQPQDRLYVLSDDGGLLYIGTELPFAYEEFMPFEYAEVKKNDSESIRFCFGHLQSLTGPYLIPTGYSVGNEGEDSYIKFTFEDPVYSPYSFLKYDAQTRTYENVTLGAYGDRFVQNPGKSSYRAEQNAAAVRPKQDEIRITCIKNPVTNGISDRIE